MFYPIIFNNKLPSKNLLLVVEDSEEDFEMFLRGVKKSSISCNLYHCETGKEALDFLLNELDDKNEQFLSQLSFILLDLNLPGTDGRVVLEKIKTHPQLKSIPVVIFSTSSNPKDIETCYHKGANAYITKPMDIRKLQQYIEIIIQHWLTINTIYSA